MPMQLRHGSKRGNEQGHLHANGRTARSAAEEAGRRYHRPRRRRWPRGPSTTARKNWRQLAFAIADGVIAHIATNMEITGIQTTAMLRRPSTGASALSRLGRMRTPSLLSATQQSVTFNAERHHRSVTSVRPKVETMPPAFGFPLQVALTGNIAPVTGEDAELAWQDRAGALHRRRASG